MTVSIIRHKITSRDIENVFVDAENELLCLNVPVRQESQEEYFDPSMESSTGHDLLNRFLGDGNDW